jgi:hypothetical protein
MHYQGEVVLSDMQFGTTIPDLLVQTAINEPDIIGISAAFGQYDLLECLADGLAGLERMPFLIFGGSLSALNAGRLLERYPTALVAHGPGELPMQDIVEYWHGDRRITDVRGVHSNYLDTLKASRDALHAASSDFLPELDLLEETLDYHGVLQLESSRGCTHACSFCPREHKGIWAGGAPSHLAFFLEAVGEVFDQRPGIARKAFLVDEEFIGNDREGENVNRALQISNELWSHQFRWETSSRVDQIYRPDKSTAWHVERLKFWTQLREQGLDRCLFGIESGVDSVLSRFNKRTTAHQNILALRLLSACDIPIRCTYITFDHLMSRSELTESYYFQGRDDLLLSPQPAISFEELLEAVQDDAFAAAHSQGVPLYSSISYMLVSMECLIGSPYLKRVEDAGLALDEVPAMGKRNAAFSEPLIGLMSECAQKWVDRNFSFDYLLKGLEKITAGSERMALRQARFLLKEYSYRLLGRFLESSALADRLPPSTIDVWSLRFTEVMDLHFHELVLATADLLESISEILQSSSWSILSKEFQIWSRRRSWALINQ